MGADRGSKTQPPRGDGMAHLVQRQAQGTHPVDAQHMDRVRHQCRQKLIGFLLVIIELRGPLW